MKIHVLSRDDDQLLVKMTPTAAWALLGFGIIMIVAAPLIVWALSANAFINLTDKEFRYRTAFFDRYVSDEFSIERKSVAKFATESRNDGKTLVVAARTADSSLHKDMRLGMLNGDAKRELTGRLNACLESGEEMTYSTGSNLALGIILGLVLFGGGTVCLWYLQTSYVCGNRSSGELAVFVKRWLIPWRRGELGRIQLADFKKVESTTKSVGGGDTPTASSNYVYASTKDGQQLGLAKGPMFTDASTEEIKNIIESWIREAPCTVAAI